MSSQKGAAAADGKRVLVIGAGCAGLCSLKECLHAGLNTVCFEMEPMIGGLWHFTEEEGNSSVYRSTTINTCKEMMCYSDFPIPERFPPFMHNTQVMEYFNLYADHFNLRPHIRFNTRVENVKPSATYAQDGSWDVTYRMLPPAAAAAASTSQRMAPPEAWAMATPITEAFSAVLVCSGHHSKKREVTFPGQERFQGRIMHSHGYKDHTPFVNRRVVVVGIGNSGLDIAVELSRFASQVYLSTRSGAWIISRVGPGGLPSDFKGNTRLLFGILPPRLREFFAENLILDKEAHKHYGLLPKHHLLSAHPSINGEFFGRIITGSIDVRPNIKEIREHSVVFTDDVEVPADDIILATGYNIGFPFLDDACNVTVKDNQVDLYKFVFPPGPAKSPAAAAGGSGKKRSRPPSGTMAFIGLVQPWGAIMPIAELQARWTVQILTGKKKLPSEKAMREDIAKVKREMAERYISSPRHTIQVDYVTHSDMLAEEIGCKPTFWDFILTDPQLALAIYTKANVPAMYRLVGPDTWDKARETIFDAERKLIPKNAHQQQYKHFKAKL